MLSGARIKSTIAVLSVVAVACTSGGAETTTSTTAASPVTTLETSTTTTQAPDTTSSTSEPKSVLTPPEYTIVDRVEGEAAGDTVVVLLDTETYDSLTDLDLYDLIAEVVELFPPIAVAHVVDDPSAANVVGNPDASQEELDAVTDNYLARLDNGFKITYLGPFASSGTAVLGS